MPSFKEKLLALHDDPTARFGKIWPEKEYNKMIQYGAIGQLAENHFLFLYRDLYRNSGFYGAVIFLNKPDELGNPIRVSCIQQNGSESSRNIYIRAALYFIKHDLENTMNLMGSVEKVFVMAKEKIDKYIDRLPAQNDKPADFNYDLLHREIKSREMKPAKIDKLFNRHLEDILDKLKAEPPLHKEQDDRPKARPGLNLQVKIKDLSGAKTIYFQPLIIPQKKDGSLHKPRKIPPARAADYEFDFQDIPAALQDFFTLLLLETGDKTDYPAKIKVLNQLYFEKMAGEIFAAPGPPVLLFCQPEDVDKEYKPLHSVKFKKAAVRFAPSLKNKNEFHIFLQFTAAGKRVLNAGNNYEIKISDANIYIFFESADNEHYFAVPEEAAHFFALFNFLQTQKTFFLYDFEKIAAALKEIASPHIKVAAKILKKYKFTLLPAPVLKICGTAKPGADAGPDNGAVHSAAGREHLEIEFDYSGEIKKFVAQNPGKEVYFYERDDTFEAACFDLLKSDSLLKEEIGRKKQDQSIYSFFSFRGNDYLKWLVEKGRQYLEKGFKIYSEKWRRYIGGAAGRIEVTVSRGIDWLEFTPMVHDGAAGQGFKIESIDADQQTVIDEKGMLHLVTKAEIDKLVHIYKYGEQHGGVVRVPSKNYVLIEALYDKRMAQIPGLSELLQTQKKLLDFKEIPGNTYKISPGFHGQLRNYQEEGFRWLNFLRDGDFPGCLADDMGLGKTVQTLALLQSLKDRKELQTALLVMPVSAVPNWENEIGKFTPGLTFYRHLGVKRDKDSRLWGKKDLVITSYATMRNDIEIFKDFNFEYIILDESQNIKNFSSLATKAAKILKGKHRLALSGTPIENNSLELWSLFDFLLPGFLGTRRWFRNQFTLPIERDKEKDKIELLKKMIYPFILRRKKEQVEQDLPEKIEIQTKLDMDEEQARLYAETAARFQAELEEQVDEQDVSKSTLQIFTAMLRLRQICLFPGLADKKYAHIPSAKFNHFTELLEDILSEDHKVLIFSQFVGVLKILREHLDKEKIEYSYIDGSVDVGNREKAIRRFQENEQAKVFLLSLKAGGYALNLTAADYVIIFDPWWNPAVEAQAIDRSHRIGQTRKVLVYRMVLAGSIEEKMLALQEQKKALVEDLITSESKTLRNLSKGEILRLFAP